MDETLQDAKFSHKLYAVVSPPDKNTLPEFKTPLEKLQIEAERAFTYTLPDFLDP